MSITHGLLIFSLVALVASKLADLWTTIRYVGAARELNPFARRLFARIGFTGGLGVVMALWLAIVVAVYVQAWKAQPWMRIIVGTVGVLVAWVQYDVAKFNAGGERSRLTQMALRAFTWWALRMHS